MKKNVILGIVVIIAICGIGGIFYINSFREAEIILSFICDDIGEERDIAFFINKDGCIYKTEDQKFIGNPNIGDFLKNNSNYAEDEKYTFISKIEEKEIKEKIRILKKIAIRNAEVEMEEISTDIYRAEKFWYAYYLKNGKIQGVILKGGGGWNWRNKDSKAGELAEWLSNVLGLYDYKYKEYDDPIMDDYLLDPEEYPRK